MSETQLLNSTSDTNPDYTSSQISTSWSHLPVKFICCDADQEELDDPASPVEGGSRGDESAHEHVRNQFGSDTSQPLRGTSSLGLNGVKSNLRNSLASIPNHLSVEYSNNRQSNSTKSVSPDCSTTSLLRTSKTSTSMLTMDTSKQHTSNTNVVVVGNDVDGVIDKIPSIGVRSNSNITISSWSTVQSRHHIDKSSPRQLSNQNVFKSSTRASSKRLANLYNTNMPVNHSTTITTSPTPPSRSSIPLSTKRSSPFKRRYPRNLLHVPLNGNWTEDVFWTVNNNHSNNTATATTITTNNNKRSTTTTNNNNTATSITTTSNTLTNGSKNVHAISPTSSSSYNKTNGKSKRRRHRQSLTPSYRSKLDQFRRIFRGTPVDTDRLLVDYSCALSKNNNGLLLQGRMYITETWVCFYSKILYEQKIFLSVNEIVSITKEKTARVIPNAIQILYSKSHERFFFTSFASRERTYAILRKVWENCRNHQAMSIEEILQQIRDMYGDHSLAMVEDEDTDGEADLAPTTYSHRLRSMSDSSISSQLTGTGRSKSGSLEDVWHSDQPVNHDQSSKCSALGTTDDELKVAGSDGDVLLSRGPSFSNPNQLSFVDSNSMHQLKEITTLRRCPTPEVLCPITSSAINLPDDIVSDSIPTSIKSGKEKKKRVRKRRIGSRHHDDISNTLNTECMNYINTHDPSSSSASPTQTSLMNPLDIHLPAVTCSPGHDHPGRVYVDTDIPLSVDALFHCIFTDSEFFSRLSELRGTFGMIQSPWPVFKWFNTSLDQVDSTAATSAMPPPISTTLNGDKVERTITYTLTLKQKLGPRTCTAVEQQTLLLSQSEFGKRYVVDAKVTNQAVPLCNCFCVVSRYCLLRVNHTTSRLHVCSQVIYEKPVFFGAKSIIENTCHSGLSDFFDTLTIQLTGLATNLSMEERLTGGWLTQKRGCGNNNVVSNNTNTNANEVSSIPQMHHRMLPHHHHHHHGTTTVQDVVVSTASHQENRRGKNDGNVTGKGKLLLTTHNKVPSVKYSDQGKQTVFNNCLNGTSGKRSISNNNNSNSNNTVSYFGSGDMTYLFMRPDRAWLLLVIISLLLCLFLSMVYNRLVVLEKLAEQFPSSPASSSSPSSSTVRDQDYISDLFGPSYSKENPLFSSSSSPSFTGKDERESIYKDQLNGQGTRLKVMKDLIQLLSKTLTQMQQTLTQVRQGIELLEVPPSSVGNTGGSGVVVGGGDIQQASVNFNLPPMNSGLDSCTSNTKDAPVT